jgi:hypothetical protein
MKEYNGKYLPLNTGWIEGAIRNEIPAKRAINRVVTRDHKGQSLMFSW